MNEYNILIKKALNYELPFLKVVPIKKRIIWSFDQTTGQYFLVEQIQYIFIDGDVKGETFTSNTEIEESRSNHLDNIMKKTCFSWKSIEYEETKEL